MLSAGIEYCQLIFGAGIGRVHRIPPVELKCLSEKRRGEIAALVGGTKAAASG
jgi:hypothetical protein